MNPKYELLETDSFKLGQGALYRIRALKAIENVCVKGDLGGYIESEDNLSHEGTCWVFNNAKVYGNAQVYDNVRVSGAVGIIQITGILDFDMDEVLRELFKEVRLAPLMMANPKLLNLAKYILNQESVS